MLTKDVRDLIRKFVLKTSYHPNVIIMNIDHHWEYKHNWDERMGDKEPDRWSKIHSIYGMRVYVDDVKEISVGFVMTLKELTKE